MAKVILTPPQEINLTPSNPTFISAKINIGTLTKFIKIRLKRPVTANPSVIWSKSSIVRITLFAELDGEPFKCIGQASGGIRIDRNGNEMSEYSLSYDLPVVMRGGVAKRIGETFKTSFKGHIELELLRGSAIKTTLIVAETFEAPAPIIQVHNSVAFNAATSAQELSGDGELSLTHTSSGSDIAYFAGVGNSAGTPLAGTLTYNSVSAIEEWDFIYQTNFADAGYQNVGQSTGPQTVQSSLAEGSPDEHGLGIISLTGVHQTTPVGTAVTASGNSGTATVTVSGTVADGLVVDNLYGPVAAVTVGADQTERYLENINTARFAGSTQSGSDGGVMSWTFSSNIWGTGAIEFKPSVVGVSNIFNNPLLTGKYPHLRM